MISLDTAKDIALTYREIEASEKLLKEIEHAMQTNDCADVRDVFGRVQGNIEMGIPSGPSSRRIFHLQWKLARPVIEAHILDCKTRLKILNEKAKSELETM